MADVTLSHIYKVYPNGVKAVNDFNMHIEDKEFIVLVGPSGCGKSTTLRMIAGLEDISAGELRIGDEVVNDVDPKERDISMVFQNYALYPHMTVYENMAFGMKIRKFSKDEIHKRILEAAEILDLTNYLDRKPKAMSGGQRQRVALGRAILRNPKVFLLDEPLSNLDAKLRTQMRTEISNLHKKLQTTFIYVTHDQVEAMTMGTRIVVMKGGFVQQIDKPKDLYNYPCNKFVAGFIGTPQMNFFNVTLKKEDNNVRIHFLDSNNEVLVPYQYLVKVKQQYLDGTKKVILGLRCEFISVDEKEVASCSTCIDVKVSHVEELGSETLIYGYLDLENEDVTKNHSNVIIKSFWNTEIEAGTTVKAAFNFSAAHYFDGKTENTISPRIPKHNIVNCEVKDNVLHFLGEELKLPKAMHCNDCVGTVDIPTDTIKLGDMIKAKVFATEKTPEGLLVYLNINGNTIFVLTNEEVTVGSFIGIDFDLKELSIKDNELNDVVKPLKLTNDIALKYLKVKEKATVETEKGPKEKKVINFKLQLLGKEYLAPSFVSSRILSALGTQSFGLNYTASLSLYAFKENEDGIEAKIESILDYGKEKFAVCDINGEKVIISIKEEKTGTIKVEPIFDSIGIKENSMDINLL